MAKTEIPQRIRSEIEKKSEDWTKKAQETGTEAFKKTYVQVAIIALVIALLANIVWLISELYIYVQNFQQT